jgi:phosphate transport system substrate-binding protein
VGKSINAEGIGELKMGEINLKAKSFLKWLTLPLALVLTLSVVVTGCGGDGGTTQTTGPTDTLSGNIDVSGSNTVTPISSQWAEDFMKLHQNVNITVSGPGSGAGIAALINKTTDVCQSSRPIKTTEIAQAKANGVNPVETKVALDALSVVVHPSNTVTTLSIQQLSDIYSGKTTNWKDVGGKDAPIVVLSRDTNSGTYAYFLEEVVQLVLAGKQDKTKQYAPSVQLLPSTEVGITQVAQNQNAIFYSGLGYLTSSVKTLTVKKTAADPAVAPSVATAKDGSYPISRFLYYYTNGEPAGVVKAFIEYALSATGQKTVETLGFVALK